MDKQEAKLILQSYRFNSQDANDPAFAEALAMAQNDPELRAWFELERASDEAVSTKLRQTPVPPDLRKAILSGLRNEPKIVRPTFKWWKSPALAWAAAITIIFATTFLIQTRPQGTGQAALANYRLTMRENLEMLSGFDFPETQPVKIKDWLEGQELLRDATIPTTLTDKKSMGCKLFPYNGSRSALICFQLPNMEMVHLFMIEKSALGKTDLTQSPTFAKCGDWDTCSWEKDGNLYLLLGKVGNNTLKMLARR
jgi:hypothetical protein